VKIEQFRNEEIEYMEKYVTWEILDNFRSLLNEEKTFCSFSDYYTALIEWIKSNVELFDMSMLQDNRIMELLDLNPEEYLIDNPSISLDMESIRMFNNKPSALDSLLMGISSTLWELISISLDENCSNCVYGELRYIIYESELTQKRELVIECEQCGYAELLNGKKWSGGMANVFPANKKDLEKFGVKISSSST